MAESFAINPNSSINKCLRENCHGILEYKYPYDPRRCYDFFICKKCKHEFRGFR